MLENFDLVEKLPEPKETMTISIENIQKSFQCKFCDQWSVSFILKSFYQIPLTWSKTYSGSFDTFNWRFNFQAKVENFLRSSHLYLRTIICILQVGMLFKDFQEKIYLPFLSNSMTEFQLLTDFSINTMLMKCMQCIVHFSSATEHQ